nr:capsid protein [Medicago sativa alphapartitivirus 1]
MASNSGTKSDEVQKSLQTLKSLIDENKIDQQLLQTLGLKSLDKFSPTEVEDPFPSKATVVAQTTLSADRRTPKEQDKSLADAVEPKAPTVASDILAPFAGIHITYAPRLSTSSYSPSSLMMDYIVHQINSNLVDNFYFKRTSPDYHPYIIRLYYGVIFWVQCIRAGHYVGELDMSKHQFLVRFLDAHPLESLTVAGPLIPLFKTLCASQPEIPTFGKVYPRLPAVVGPNRRDEFIKNDITSNLLPNVPGIFALLEHLNGIINPTPPADPAYPKKGMHIPVTATANQATIFGHHTFPVPAERTNRDRWALCSSGLQYECEADARLNEAFAERYSKFRFPTHRANDALIEIDYFLSMDVSMAWFAQVKKVAAAAAAYFEGSGTLVDCPPHGIAANQIIVSYVPPLFNVTAPTRSADPASQFPFAFKLATSARNLPTLSESMAAMAQTNVMMYRTHPYFGDFGIETIEGEFWDIRPLESSLTDSSTYLSLDDSVTKMMKSKN